MSNWINSHDWRQTIPSPLSRVDLDKWQSKLDEIAGVEDDGTKRWRLVWGQDMEATGVWDRYKQTWTPRYPAGFTTDYVANPSTGVLELKKTWHGVPRYFAEALVPRVHRNAKIEAPGVDPDGDAFVERRVIGADYVTMFCITQHSSQMKNGWRPCCLRRLQNEQTCFGFYRPPDEADIEQLREDYDSRVTSKMCRPDEKPTAADKNFFYHSWMLNHMRDAEKRSKEMDASRAHILKTLIPAGASFGQKKGRFALPN